MGYLGLRTVTPVEVRVFVYPDTTTVNVYSTLSVRDGTCFLSGTSVLYVVIPTVSPQSIGGHQCVDRTLILHPFITTCLFSIVGEV